MDNYSQLEKRIQILEKEINCKDLEKKVQLLENEIKHLKTAFQYQIGKKSR